MEDYGQFVDIENGLRNNNDVRLRYINSNKSYLFNTNYIEKYQLIPNDHFIIDINESIIEEYIDQHTPISILPLAFTYFWFCIRRIINM